MIQASVSPVCVRCDDLWIVTAYFNPCAYRSRRVNYELFSERLHASGLNLVTIECAFGDAPFDLPGVDGIIRVRAKDILWQKERLLNLAITHLPVCARKVAWLDADLLFDNPLWAQETSRLLETFIVVQPFTAIIGLGPTGTADILPGAEGFAAVWGRDPGAVRLNWSRHGLTGYGWAYRRDLLDVHGLYDAHLGGGGDHAMAHAMCGDFDSPCAVAGFSTSLRKNFQGRWSGQFLRRLAGSIPLPVKNWFDRRSKRHANEFFRNHFLSWARPFYSDVHGQIGHASGVVRHLWHGDPSDRRYAGMRSHLVQHRFDPAADIRIGPSGCWEWASDKPGLHAKAREFFSVRREDGPN